MTDAPPPLSAPEPGSVPPDPATPMAPYAPPAAETPAVPVEPEPPAWSAAAALGLTSSISTPTAPTTTETTSETTEPSASTPGGSTLQLTRGPEPAIEPDAATGDGASVTDTTDYVGVPVAAPTTNGIAHAAMVIGIISLPTLLVCGVGALAGGVAIVLGAMGISRANRIPGMPGKGRAITGVVTGIVSVLLAAGFITLLVATDSESEFRADPPNGVCDSTRFMQDPDC